MFREILRLEARRRTSVEQLLNELLQHNSRIDVRRRCSTAGIRDRLVVTCPLPVCIPDGSKEYR